MGETEFGGAIGPLLGSGSDGFSICALDRVTVFQHAIADDQPAPYREVKANSDSINLPVAFISEAGSPRMTAVSLEARRFCRKFAGWALLVCHCGELRCE